MDRQLKTTAGSIIQRYSKGQGVGKVVGSHVYMHKLYAPGTVPDDVWQKALHWLSRVPGNFTYNGIRWNTKTNEVCFQQAADFDVVHEPTVGQCITIQQDGNVKCSRSAAIWHHKWLWVADDYTGFDVQASYERSQQWLTFTDVQFKKIGNRQHWQTYLAGKKIEV